MSRVTNAILTTHVSEGTAQIDWVNRRLEESTEGGGGKFMEVTQQAGGDKHMEVNVYLSAFNHANTRAIVEAVEQAPWIDGDMVQLFVKEQEEDLFRVRYAGCRDLDQPSRTHRT